jgi:hypothetical protein
MRPATVGVQEFHALNPKIIMTPIANKSDREIMEEIDSYPDLTDATSAGLEHDLILTSCIRGWTGAPLCQPGRTVLAILRKIYRRTTSRTPRSEQ